MNNNNAIALIGAVVLSGLAAWAHAEVHTEKVTYKQGDTVLEGYLAYDAAAQGKRPGVLVVHDWMGPGKFSNGRAEELAKLGYVALAVDIYGKNARPEDTTDAGMLAGIYKSDRKLLRERILAGLATLKARDNVDPDKIAAIGYCFGGMAALELARSGAPVVGIVTFHGSLDTPTPEDAKNIKGKVLALHGADDPFVTAEHVAGFENEMRKAGVDWELVKYSKAVHAFTNPQAGTDNSKGAAYNAEADKRSWIAMKDFFAEIFGQK
jgi:dienelactone hydrolase